MCMPSLGANVDHPWREAGLGIPMLIFALYYRTLQPSIAQVLLPTGQLLKQTLIA